MRVFPWLFFPGAMHFLVFFLLCLSSRADLLVILQPPEVVCADASWSIHPGQWHVSEESIFLPAGSHRLQFASLPGWVAPSPWPLQLAVAGQNAVIIATYSKLVPADSIFHLLRRAGQENFQCQPVIDFTCFNLHVHFKTTAV